MMRRSTLWAVLVALFTVSWSLPAFAAPDSSGDSPIFLVMDRSTSMEGEKIKKARAAARQLAFKVGATRPISVFAYPGGPNKDGCGAGEFIYTRKQFNKGITNVLGEPVGTRDLGLTIVNVPLNNSLTPTGDTPTGPALRQIVRHIEKYNIKNAKIVLVTDGEANCGDTDICSIGQEIVQKGIDLQVNTISVDNTPRGDEALSCLAETTGGTFVSVENTENLDAIVAQSHAHSLEVTAELPPVALQTTGNAHHSAPKAVITVRNTGTGPIPNAKLILTFSNDVEPGVRSVRVPNSAIYFGNLTPGQQERREVKFFPKVTQPGSVSWRVGTYSGSQPLYGNDVSGKIILESSNTIDAAGPILRDAKNVVILGDSYSSGEGAVGYATQGDSKKFYKCHRSQHAYGSVLFPNAKMIACSGAVTDHLYRPNALTYLTVNDRRLNHRDFVPSQLEALHREVKSADAPDLVLLTFGGNDAGFGHLVSWCVMQDCTPDALATTHPGLFTKLVRAYSDINAVVNTPEAVKKRSGKIAQIVVLPYVDSIPDATGAHGQCFSGVTTQELARMKSFLHELNAVVRRAVEVAQQKNSVPVHYADSVVGAFQPHHTMCAGDDSYLIAGNILGTALTNPDKKQELAHPNAAGHQAIAHALVEWSINKDLLTTNNVKNKKHVFVGLYQQLPERFYLKRRSDKDPFPHLHEESLVLGERGCPFEKRSLPDCQIDGVFVWGTLKSVPTPLGVAVRNPDGTYKGTWSIPMGTPAGKHTLVVSSVSAEGSVSHKEETIWVFPRGTNTALFVSLVGVVFLFFASLLKLSARLFSPRTRR